MLHLLLLAIFAKCVWTYESYGYDSGGGTTNTCGRPYRAGRMHKPPCNLANEGGFCKDAGDNYPWHAVKRFVKENRGLMRRMYGEQPEGSLLREELARISPENVRDRIPRQQNTLEVDNDLYSDEDEKEFDDLFHGDNSIKQEYGVNFEGRYLHDEDVLRTKFIYSEEPTMSIKLAGLKTAPHFRQASTTITTTDSISTSESSESPTTTSTTLSSTESTTKSDTGNPTSVNSSISETSHTDLENSTVATLREVDEIVEVTTEIDENISSTTEETEKPTKFSSTTSQSTKAQKYDRIQTSTKTASSSPKPENAGILFQDMEEGESEKVKVNYKLTGVNACPVKEEVVAPFWANNTRGEVLALLNMYPFEQYVHWEKCSFENKQMYCREGCRCEQQYRLHRLLAYDPQNECKGIFSDWFRFPSCCVCKCYGLPSEFRVTSRSPRNGEVQWFDTGPKRN